jgi:protein-S-isoprenylcysteine O-methyltransferase Ste14
MPQKTSRDYLYVGIQFLLFLAYVPDVAAMGFSRPDILEYVGLGVAITGLCTGVLALLQMRKSFSPFPTPVAHGELVTNGLFAWARHPIYSSILLGAFGYGLYTGSGYRLAIGILLLLLFNAKAGYEEIGWTAHYQGYPAYKKRVGRFIKWM